MLGGLLTEVCQNVALEPCLASLTGESFPRRTTNVSDGARPDIKVRGFWTSHEDAFFDVRVFALTHLHTWIRPWLRCLPFMSA